MQKRYQTIKHKADLKIKVRGKDLKELFSNALVGMLETAGYESESKGEIESEIRIESFDTDSLLVDFLNEAIYLSETQYAVYNAVEFKELSEKKLIAVLKGYPLKKMETQIKGATYHDLKIKKSGRGFEATILFDI